jgi:nitroreductase
MAGVVHSHLAGGQIVSMWDIILKSRSRRRFYQKKRVAVKVLKELVDLGRMSPSGGNLQPLKYMLSNEAKRNQSIFETLSWAGYIDDWDGPAEGERPAAYVIILGDTDIAKSPKCDCGIAAQSIMLGAAEAGLGGCMFGVVDRKKLRKSLQISKRYEIMLVIALGKPSETVAIETVRDDNIKYWRDARGVHHVPKRRMKDIIVR